jgi:hypothetical protein
MKSELVRQRVRSRTQLSIADFPDEDIQSACDAALTEFSRQKGKSVYGVINVQQDVDVYPYPTGISKLKEVLYDASVLAGFGLAFAADFPIQLLQNLNVERFGGNVFENPSLSKVFFEKLKNFQESFGTSFQELNTVPKTFRLTPAPQVAGQAYYEGRAKWALVEIYEEDEEVFMKAVLWKVAESRANQISVMQQMSQAGGISFQPANKFWQDQAEKYRKSFELEVGGLAGGVFLG